MLFHAVLVLPYESANERLAMLDHTNRIKLFCQRGTESESLVRVRYHRMIRYDMIAQIQW